MLGSKLGIRVMGYETRGEFVLHNGDCLVILAIAEVLPDT